MNVLGIVRITGAYLYIMACFLAIGACVGVWFHESAVAIAFLESLLLCSASAWIMRRIAQKTDRSLQLKEVLLAVVSIWILSIIFAALPFTMSGVLDHFLDACFEVVSGLTTTGISILHPKQYDPHGKEIPIQSVFYGFQYIEYTFYGTIKPLFDSNGKIVATGIEAVPKALLFWRAFLNWVGGLGVVFLFVALLPALGQRGRMLFRYESTGPVFSPLFPQARKTSLALALIYLVLTLLCIGAFIFFVPNMKIFDAICTSFSALATGGFSVTNAGIASYNSLSAEVITMIFMVLGAINFALFYDLWKGKLFKLFQLELFVFLALIAILGCIVSWDIIGAKKFTLTDSGYTGTYSVEEAFRYGFFQVITAITTTGFTSIDYDQWPFLGQTIMLVLMYCGGMAGSTAGGLKIIRVCILFQCARSAVHSIFNRNQIRPIRVGDREINNETAFGVLAFFLILMGTALVGILGLVFCGVDPETALGLSGSLLGNVGCAFRMAGPTSSCAFLGTLPKLISMAWMLLGRLEFYIWLAIFLPSFWKKD